MPCTYDDPVSNQYHYCKEKEYKKKLDKTTRLLCMVMKTLENTPEYAQWPQFSGKNFRELNDWWEKHKQMDAKRLAAEARAKAKIKAEAEKKTKEELALKKKLSSLKNKLSAEEVNLIKKHL